jgi:hypothetical protein
MTSRPVGYISLKAYILKVLLCALLIREHIICLCCVKNQSENIFSKTIFPRNRQCNNVHRSSNLLHILKATRLSSTCNSVIFMKVYSVPVTIKTYFTRSPKMKLLTQGPPFNSSLPHPNFMFYIINILFNENESVISVSYFIHLRFPSV